MPLPLPTCTCCDDQKTVGRHRCLVAVTAAWELTRMRCARDHRWSWPVTLFSGPVSCIRRWSCNDYLTRAAREEGQAVVRKVEVKLVDDLDGGAAEESVMFALDGTN